MCEWGDGEYEKLYFGTQARLWLAVDICGSRNVDTNDCGKHRAYFTGHVSEQISMHMTNVVVNAINRVLFCQLAFLR